MSKLMVFLDSPQGIKLGDIPMLTIFQGFCHTTLQGEYAYMRVAGGVVSLSSNAKVYLPLGDSEVIQNYQELGKLSFANLDAAPKLL